ncbi:MAG: preprotein translocase subunit SecG [Ruminococcaceae bacterium]|nr:preprotein translocase subunit SecG [Oscillospiraceae bacterium]
MGIWEYIIGIVLIIMSLLVIAVVLLQEGREANLGAISGAADTFMEKGKARTLDAFLSKWTKVISIAFFVLVFVGMLVTQFVAK